MLRRRFFLTIGFISLLLFVSGCSTNPTQLPPIQANQGGFWDRYFVYPLSWLLDESAVWAGGSYGLAILITTIVIRILVLPLMIKQIKSSKRMQALQPEMAKIKEKFKDNQQKIQEETMKLFQKHNVNPLAGCFPLLVQMPILIAFYQAIMRNPNVYSHNFLWLSLGTPDPYYILPILAAITTYLQSKIMGTGATPQQNAQMKMMLVVMPAFIFFIAITLPSALSLYWVYGNIFTIIQTFVINRKDEPILQGGKAK